MNMIEARASIRNFQCNFQSGRLSLGVLKPNPQDARMLGTLSLRKRVAELANERARAYGRERRCGGSSNR